LSVIDLAGHRPPVVYTVNVAHYWDGTIEARVDGVSDDARSKDSVADAFAKVAALYMTGQQIHTVILSRIDALMTAERGTSEMTELGALVDACQALERWLVPELP